MNQTEPCNQLPIAGFKVTEMTPDGLAIRLLDSVDKRQKVTLLFANSNFIVKCNDLLPLMSAPEVIIVNDGVGMDIAARLLYGRAFKANLNGTDFTPYLFRESEKPLKVFMYGGKPEVVEKAAAFVSNELGQYVVGYFHGYENAADDVLVDAINNSGADVLLVALGNPLQEAWILKNRAALNVPVACGVGALFDFWAGDKPRAPRFIQCIRMEWFYRLCLEPRRLMRRYTIDMLAFFMACFRKSKSSNTNNQQR
ncbi:MAG: WecB/TagA/CpsF family glycosyltransferase [Nitrosomonadales bacterium]|nr:WecB/TagA/CpsF family glycosyltransferase [Nitrosomonadales bacterium]